MGIRLFIILLIVLTIVFLFVEKEEVVQNITNETKPKVSFYNSTMYEITDTAINQVVTSAIVNLYDKKEELYDATIITKAKENSYDTNTLSGNKIVKKEDDIYLTGAVNIILSDKTNIKTEQLDYNTKTKIATNKVNFLVTRDDQSFYGNGLFLDTINEKVEAENIKFSIKVIE